MKRPNILILYTDQQRWDALGAIGNDEIITPNLDKLAHEGVTFTHHFVQAPVCMPSRVSMLSGQYPSTLKITHMGVPVPEDIVIMPTLLNPYGYRTANIGKLHFLPHANRDHRRPHPDYGFQHMEISDEPGVYEDAYRAWVRSQAPEQMDRISVGLPPTTAVWHEVMDVDDGIKHRDDPNGRKDNKDVVTFRADDHLTHTAFVAEQTQEFIRQQSEQPFLCIAGFYSPHAPWIVPRKYLDMYDRDALTIPTFPPDVETERQSGSVPYVDDDHLRDAKHGYYAMITEVDDYVGRIMHTLNETGHAENTIVVFVSDHGEWLGDHLRYGKSYPADDAVSRVPLIISVPDGHKGKQVNHIVESVDILPTLLDLARIQIPPDLQGDSLIGLIHGDTATGDGLGLTEGNGWKCIRTPDYRYLMHDDGRECLWDMTTDPDAYHDVAQNADYASALVDCRHKLLTRLLSMERPLPRTWTY